MVRARYRGSLPFRVLAAAVALTFMLSFTTVGYTLPAAAADTSSQTTATATPPAGSGEAAAPAEAPSTGGDTAVPADAAAPVVETVAKGHAKSSGASRDDASAPAPSDKQRAVAVAAAGSVKPSAVTLTSGVGQITLEGYRLGQTSWTTGNLGKDYHEGDWVPFRFIMYNSGSSPLSVSAFSLDYDFLNKGAIGYDRTKGFRVDYPSGGTSSGDPMVGGGSAVTPSSQDVPTASKDRLVTSFPAGVFTIPAGGYAVVYFEAHLAISAYWELQSPAYEGSGFYPGSSLQMRVDTPSGDRTVTCPIPPVPQGVISGYKFNDLNQNGVKDAGEPGLAGWTITLHYSDGSILSFDESTVTAADGSYSFTQLPAGSFSVSEVQQNGWTNTTSLPIAFTLGVDQVKTGVNVGNFQPNPGLTLTKSANPTTYSSVGQVITYTYTLRNSGNVTLSAPFSVNDDKLTVSMAGAPSTLAPGASFQVTATHTITQADLDAGSITNHATAHAKWGSTTVDSNQATATVTAVQRPSLALDKVANPVSYGTVGQVITYSYHVTNNGNVTLSAPFTVDDDKTTVNASGAPSTLAPGASFDVTATYVITQGDLNAGSVTNHATAHGKFGATTVNSNQAQATITANQGPALSLVKVANPTTYDHVGQTITYTYTVTNSGNVTLVGPFTVTDDKTTVNTSGAPGTLAPGASFQVTATYAITQADLDSNGVTNHATAHGFFGSNAVNSNQATATVVPVPAPAVHLDKVANPTTYDHVGQVITYTYTLTNTGNVTLVNPFSVTDDKTSVTPITAATVLLPGHSVQLTATYVISQADLDAGSVTNHATGHATWGATTIDSNQATATVTAVQRPSLHLDKAAAPTTYDHVGQVITYTYTVTNNGNVTLSAPFTVDDNKTTVNASGAPATLAPNASFQVTATYTIAQADLDAGSVTNLATAHGKFGATTIDSNQATATVTAVQRPSLHLDKAAAPTTYDHVGQVITYTYTVTNNGNVTLSAPFTIGDDKTSVSMSGAPATLAPNGSFQVTATYAILQADLDAGSVTNHATAHAKFGATVDSNQAQATVTVVAHPSLLLDKSASPATYDHVGQVITYTYVLTNNGNVTLISPFTVTDDKTSVTPLLAVALAPGQSTTMTATYTIAQADLDAGSVTNHATAHGMFGTTVVNSNQDQATVTAVQNPLLALKKSASPVTYNAVGQVITYTYHVTNTGNVTLSAPFTVTDDKTTVNAAGAPATLAPGASFDVTSTYAIKQADLDAGSVTNHATAHGMFGSTTVNSNQDQATVTAEQHPLLALSKTPVPTSYGSVGQAITYTYHITNTGNVTLSAPFSVTDDKTSVPMTGAPATLAPGASFDVTSTYLITQADLDAGSVTNHATAHGMFGSTTVNSNQAQATVTANQGPALALAKSASPTTYDHVGQVITYTYTLTNSGNVTLSAPFSVNDDKTTVSMGGAPASLAPGASFQVTATYVITQADLDSAGVTNHAVATAHRGETTITSNQAQATVIPVPAPALHLDKVASPTTYDHVGQVITYTYTLSNTGNVTLFAPFTVTDDKTTVAPSAATVLLPGASLTFTATYVVTQADLDAGSVTNHATGHATFRQLPIDSNQAQATVTAAQNPALTIVKTPSASVALAGDSITYTYVVTNTGNITLAPVVVTDDKLGAIGTIPSLAPGASTTLTATAVMTSVDVTNIGTATSGSVVATDDAFVDVVHPAIDVTKTSDAPVGGVPLGSTVTYTYTVTNTGDVPLVNVSLVDDQLGTVVTGVSLAVGESRTFTMTTVPSATVTNIVTASGQDANGHQVSDTASATVDVFAPFTPPDLTITKSPSPSSAAAGDEVVYTLRYRNLSGSAAQDFTITDKFDSRYMTVVDANGGDTSVAGQITWTLFTGDTGLSVDDGWQTLTYTLRVKSDIPDDLTHVDNTATVFIEDDSDPSNNTATATVDILPFLPFTGGAFPDPTAALIAAFGAAALLIGLRRRDRRDS